MSVAWKGLTPHSYIIDFDGTSWTQSIENPLIIDLGRVSALPTSVAELSITACATTSSGKQICSSPFNVSMGGYCAVRLPAWAISLLSSGVYPFFGPDMDISSDTVIARASLEVPLPFNYAHLPIPTWVPIVGGDWGFGVPVKPHAEFNLACASLSLAGGLNVEFAKTSGEWQFRVGGGAEIEGTWGTGDALVFDHGEFEWSLRGQASKNWRLPDVFEPLKVAEGLPWPFGPAFQELFNTISLTVGVKGSLSGNFDLIPGDPGWMGLHLDPVADSLQVQFGIFGGLKGKLAQHVQLRTPVEGLVTINVKLPSGTWTAGFSFSAAAEIRITFFGAEIFVGAGPIEVDLSFASPGTGPISVPTDLVIEQRTRSYARDGFDAFIGETNTLDEEGMTVYSLLANPYPSASPSVWLGKSDAVVAWASDDLNLPPIQGTGIYGASVPLHGGQNPVPMSISNSPAAEEQPTIIGIGDGKLVACWTSSGIEEAGKGEISPELFRSLEIVCSVFDGSDWSDPIQITENNIIDHQPLLLADSKSNDIVLLWIANSEADSPFPPSQSPDEIWMSTFSSGEFAQPSLLQDVDSATSRRFSLSSGKLVYAGLHESIGDGTLEASLFEVQEGSTTAVEFGRIPHVTAAFDVGIVDGHPYAFVEAGGLDPSAGVLRVVDLASGEMQEWKTTLTLYDLHFIEKRDDVWCFVALVADNSSTDLYLLTLREGQEEAEPAVPLTDDEAIEEALVVDSSGADVLASFVSRLPASEPSVLKAIHFALDDLL